MAAAKSFSDGIDVARDDEVSRAFRVGAGSRARQLSELDEPFADDDALLPEFITELRARRIADIYLPAFEHEALAFRTRFRHAPTEHLDAGMLDVHVEEGRLQSLPERALRNRRVGVHAYLDFLQRRRRAALPPLPAPVPTATTGRPAEKRCDRRAPLLTDVRVDGFGVKRSADISVGGIYLEGLTTAARGTSLRLQFELFDVGRSAITATARVAFVHPQFGAGLEFVSMAPEHARRIADFVARASGNER
jgi:hypothetical protein